ncbi:hypothetical protein BP422_21855 [Brevibacillus formosus]|uniref:Uncharacterized protein n=1 Tax=Brevibacillus formosus TaxID=54913 RepID=A0A220MMH0_9BACL|nr:hypothetical protein BP422_21855 [Brevibacillus formosus]
MREGERLRRIMSFMWCPRIPGIQNNWFGIRFLPQKAVHAVYFIDCGADLAIVQVKDRHVSSLDVQPGNGRHKTETSSDKEYHLSGESSMTC